MDDVLLKYLEESIEIILEQNPKPQTASNKFKGLYFT
jgi:hypothetical protein